MTLVPHQVILSIAMIQIGTYTLTSMVIFYLQSKSLIESSPQFIWRRSLLSQTMIESDKNVHNITKDGKIVSFIEIQ
jgi:hypothetical protein